MVSILDISVDQIHSLIGKLPASLVPTFQIPVNYTLSVYPSSSLPIFIKYLLWARMWTKQNPSIHETQSSGERDLKYINTYMMPDKMLDFLNEAQW